MKLLDKLRGWFHPGATTPPSSPHAAIEKHAAVAAAAKEYITMAEQAETFEKRYLGELFELEAAILAVFHDHAELTDRQVDNAVEAVMDAVRAKQLGRSRREFNLTDMEQAVFEQVWEACQRLQGAPQSQDAHIPNPFPCRICTLQEVADCLKRIRKSIRHWSKDGEPQEYLEIVAEYLTRILRKAYPQAFT